MRRNPINYGDIVVEPNTSTAIDNWRVRRSSLDSEESSEEDLGIVQDMPLNSMEGRIPSFKPATSRPPEPKNHLSYTNVQRKWGMAQSRLWPVNTLAITISIANIAETAILFAYPACFPDSVVGFVADESKCDVRFIEYVFSPLTEPNPTRTRRYWAAFKTISTSRRSMNSDS